MKTFKVPEVEVVYFGQKDVIATSSACVCVDCQECPEGKDNCRCYDIPGSNE
jgi:hypothetical protein